MSSPTDSWNDIDRDEFLEAAKALKNDKEPWRKRNGNKYILLRKMKKSIDQRHEEEDGFEASRELANPQEEVKRDNKYILLRKMKKSDSEKRGGSKYIILRKMKKSVEEAPATAGDLVDGEHVPAYIFLRKMRSAAIAEPTQASNFFRKEMEKRKPYIFLRKMRSAPTDQKPRCNCQEAHKPRRPDPWSLYWTRMSG